ncbi:O(6)-alkylguanine repair protein YbaZ [Sanguibacter gelidistatuariae]|uniref:O(6)-alkylguanine repair protein YbaZ n=1 Tax=Sanguibacter gelidistatuariae TaxID=1814289 RepID=A0A1G6N9L0_9MICO|nr:MGMT family protein [Sanguibacter gelidistatuariae]SDC64550.1 O(6)-alkylguanine repair protein YbaZ [Sanguibacter gelidistatuariae]
MDEEYRELVLDVVEAIPAGRVMTYGAVAALVGQTLQRGGPRQVGTVLRQMGGGVPWWRVVNAAGQPPLHKRALALERLRGEGCPLTPDGSRVALAAAHLDTGPGARS